MVQSLDSYDGLVLNKLSSLLQRHFLVTDGALSHTRAFLPLIYPVTLSLALNLSILRLQSRFGEVVFAPGLLGLEWQASKSQ